MVNFVAKELGIENAFGDLLPEDKVNKVKEIKDRTTDFVQKNPMTSIAIAVGVGYILGKLLSGRRS